MVVDFLRFHADSHHCGERLAERGKAQAAMQRPALEIICSGRKRLAEAGQVLLGKVGMHVSDPSQALLRAVARRLRLTPPAKQEIDGVENRLRTRPGNRIDVGPVGTVAGRSDDPKFGERATPDFATAQGPKPAPAGSADRAATSASSPALMTRVARSFRGHDIHLVKKAIAIAVLAIDRMPGPFHNGSGMTDMKGLLDQLIESDVDLEHYAPAEHIAVAGQAPAN